MSTATPSDFRALITGVTGQDGYYLARLLLSRGVEVYGAIRPADRDGSPSIQSELPGLKPVALNLPDADSIREALRIARPNRIFHLAGVSHVGESWRDPERAMQVNAVGTLRLLEAIRQIVPQARLVFAGSGDCFDHARAADTGLTPNTPIRCTNPYAVSKLAAMQFVQCYRREHGLMASVAIMMNHTSVRRPKHFVEQLIVRQAVATAQRKAPKVILGSIDTVRDWSWAEDIVEGLAAMAECDEPQDLVLSSGQVHTTGDWIRRAFDRLDLNETDHFAFDPSRLHAGDRPHTFGNIEGAADRLGWKPKVGFDEMVDRLIEAELSASGDDSESLRGH